MIIDQHFLVILKRLGAASEPSSVLSKLFAQCVCVSDVVFTLLRLGRSWTVFPSATANNLSLNAELLGAPGDPYQGAGAAELL